MTSCRGPCDPTGTTVRSDRRARSPTGSSRTTRRSTPQDYDQYLYAATEDVQAFWREQYPLVYGTAYPELEGGVHPLSREATPIPGCGEPESDYADVEGNAFYCALGDFIAYDDAQLFPELAGSSATRCSASSWRTSGGHAIQMRQGLLDGSLSTVTTELQADCFAGA